MQIEELIQYYPTLYHMAECGSWGSIRKNGLLSTTALLDRFHIGGQGRLNLETKQRKECITVGQFASGPAIIRDQLPLNEKALGTVLDGMTTAQFYKLLNGKTFFWARKERLERLLKGRHYKDRSHDVLTVDTAALVKNHLSDLWLSRINSGAFFGSGRRGVGTFRRVEDYPFDEIRRKKKEDAVVEVAIDYAVNDISNMTLRVESWIEDRVVGVIWSKSS